MKARPRSVENRVAEALNDNFTLLNVSNVERIPVLGRTGPDISINELGLVVDVKSRKEISKTIFFPLITPFSFDSFIAVRLENLRTLWDEHYPPALLAFSSKLIADYWVHMEEWTQGNAEGSISCIILHRPEMPIGSSVVVIHTNSRRRLIENANRYSFTNPC